MLKEFRELMARGSLVEISVHRHPETVETTPEDVALLGYIPVLLEVRP